MATRALVLGGGGPVGIAWETGLAAGLEAGGVRLAEADFILGTSAGSVVGAQLALGRSPQEMLETQRTMEPASRPSALRGPIDLSGLMAELRRLYAGEAPVDEARRRIGALALAADTMSEEEWLASFGSVRDITSWPERPYACTAIDTADGTLVTWDRDSGVPVGLAVASSCAVPGVVPPVTIDGHRYMDGGIGTTTNATLARGYDRVLVVSVTAGSARSAAADQTLLAAVRERFERELQDVRDAGSDVELIVPDDASREVMGINLMDGSRRAEIADAGLRQGEIEAARLKAWWHEPRRSNRWSTT